METIKPSAQNAATPGETRAKGALASRSMETTLAGTVTIAAGADRYLTERQAEILERRGINLELAAKMRWRSSGRSGFGEMIEIPYFRKGREVNCKTRSIEGEKRFYQVEGGEKCFYNVDAIDDLGEETLVITEGEMDCMIALQCGYVAVSVPDGAPKDAVGDRQSVKYDYLADIPAKVKKIILAVDGDGPGVNLMHDLSIRLGKHRCMWVKYPAGCKDLNDAYLKGGEKAVSEALKDAKYLQISGIYRMSELPPLPEAVVYDVGIDALYDHYRLRCGDFSVVTGIPSHGKSTFMNHIAFNMAKIHGWGIAFASFEQQPQTEHLKALRVLHGGSHKEADAWIDRCFTFIVQQDEDNEPKDLAWLLDRMAAAVVRHNAKMIIIDPWNDLEHGYARREMTMTEYVGRAIKEFKRFSRQFMVHVCVIAHPAKLQKNKDGAYPIPTAYDISDSAHWYNRPEQVVVIHRQPSGNTLVRIAKSRYHYALGNPGDVELKFDKETFRFDAPATTRSWVAE
jgi:twinkle protein